MHGVLQSSDHTPDKLIVGSTTDLEEASYFSNYGACVHVHVRSPAATHLPARPLPHTEPPAPPRVCAGPWL